MAPACSSRVTPPAPTRSTTSPPWPTPPEANLDTSTRAGGDPTPLFETFADMESDPETAYDLSRSAFVGTGVMARNGNAWDDPNQHVLSAWVRRDAER